MFKCSGEVEQRILGNSKCPHSVQCIMAELGNKLSATPLNPAAPTPHVPQNLSGRVLIAAASQRNAESVSERTQPFVLCQDASFIL